MEKLTPQNLADAVNKFIEDNDLNKTEFAEIAGVSRPTVYKVLRAQKIEYPQMLAIGEAIGYIFYMKDNKKT